MCGIAGYWSIPLRTENRLPFVRQMCNCIVHRGPDDEGYFTDDHAGLGMRRLSIIDLASGHQPITSQNGNIHIVFNGEIYNYNELRPPLEQSGYIFQTNSDTEVILHQYQKDGPACVNKLNGMFAFAIWNSQTKTLFIARDRMGVKPLYYYWNGKEFLFASEIKAILATGIPTRQLNQQALWDYLSFRYVPQPETIWQNIHKLPPGHHLTISLDQPHPHIQRYWDIPFHDGHNTKSEKKLLSEFEELFIDSVRLRLISDVPVGILLSGGLDSSAVSAAVAELHNSQLNSYSVAFSDSPDINELLYAREVALHVGTNHHEVTIGQKEFIDFLPQFVRYIDEPLADLASIPLYYVSKLARQDVKVVLSGEGSDEILGGYTLEHYMKYWDQFDKWNRLPDWVTGNLTQKIAGRIKPEWRAFMQQSKSAWNLSLNPAQANMTYHLDSDQKSQLFYGKTHPNSINYIKSELNRVKSHEPLNQLLYVFCQSWLVEDLLMKADKMSMANSIELRTPFLDYRLVEWAAKIPTKMKIGKDDTGTYQTKRVLRQFSQNRLPSSIINRPKLGFPVPLYDWLPNRLKSWAYDIFTSNNAHLYRWLDKRIIMNQLQTATQHNATVLDRHRLWDLIIFELWCREWQPL